MSLERVITALECLGLSRLESEVYVYLAKAGPIKARDLEFGLRLSKQELYPVLKSLKQKGIVKSKQEHVELFYALAFEEVLNQFINLGTEQTKVIRETKKELINSWKKMTRKNNR